MANPEDENTRTTQPVELVDPMEESAQADAKAPTALVESPEEKSARLEREKQELHERLLRTAADFENFRRRSKKEQEDASARGREGLLKEILPVVDNLERALKHASGDDPIATGVRLVEKQLLGALEKFGIVRFSALGKPFDPSEHEAIQQLETDAVPPGAVAEEFAQGYLHNGRLLRPAMVAVAKAPPGQSDAGAAEADEAPPESVN